jgi:hypothetical protein
MTKNKLSLTVLFIMVAAMLVLSGCIPHTRLINRRAAFPAMNEKIYVHQVKDSSSLNEFDGWPKENVLIDKITSLMKKFDSNALVEFRRDEKYGMYETSEDSLLAGIQIYFTIQHYKFKKDTLLLPVMMTIKQPSAFRSYKLLINAYGIYRVKSAPESKFHYIYLVLSDFCRYFPYDKAAGVLFNPEENIQNRN